jgi:hypothetical protein
MDKLFLPLMPIILIAYFGVGLLAVAAIIGGLDVWVGLPWFLAVIIAFPVAMVPILGSGVGVAGAIEAWGWEWYWAVLLFFWPTALGLLAMLIFGGSEALSSLRKPLDRNL